MEEKKEHVIQKKNEVNGASSYRYNFPGPEGSGSVNLVGCGLFPESVLSTS